MCVCVRGRWLAADGVVPGLLSIVASAGGLYDRRWLVVFVVLLLMRTLALVVKAVVSVPSVFSAIWHCCVYL